MSRERKVENRPKKKLKIVIHHIDKDVFKREKNAGASSRTKAL